MAVSNQRVIALSATVPNIEDVARWLNGISTFDTNVQRTHKDTDSLSEALPLCFGEEYRPVKLSRYVYGIQDNGGNPFMFEKKLEWK
jgi:superfamily II RNA helicase